VTLSAAGNTVEAINNIGIRFKVWRTGTKNSGTSLGDPIVIWSTLHRKFTFRAAEKASLKGTRIIGERPYNIQIC